MLDRDGLIEPEEPDPDGRAVADLTREPLGFPAGRDARLQNLARADEGFVLALGYATQRGYGRNHPFAGEIRVGEVEIELVPEELGFPDHDRRDHGDRVPDGEPVQGLGGGSAAVHARVRADVRPQPSARR